MVSLILKSQVEICLAGGDSPWCDCVGCQTGTEGETRCSVTRPDTAGHHHHHGCLVHNYNTVNADDNV